MAFCSDLADGNRMSKRLEAFIVQIRELAPIKADPAKGDAFEEELRSLFAEDDERSLELSDSINWILKQERSAEEKLAAIGKLLDADETARPGTVIDVKKLLGW